MKVKRRWEVHYTIPISTFLEEQEYHTHRTFIGALVHYIKSVRKGYHYVHLGFIKNA